MKRSGAAASASEGAVSHRHTCQFYESDAFLCAAVARFVDEGLRQGQPVVVIGRDDHLVELERLLASMGHDLADAGRAGGYRAVDARDTLAGVMDGARPDEGRFRGVMGRLIDRASAGRAGPVRVYGEMVDVLWREGNPGGALRMEELWNDLVAERHLALLCGYSMGNFYRSSDRERFEELCRLHDRVKPAEDAGASPDGPARDLEISLLQQRARSLQAELADRRALEDALRDALAERRRTEEALQEAKERAEEASRAKSQFMAVMSHELRTPLNAIFGYQDLLEHGVGGSLTPEQRAYLSRQRSCSQQLLRLIDQVLNLSRVEASRIELHFEPLDPVAIARETTALVEPAALRRGLTVEVAGPREPLAVETDGGTLRQILLNLLTNAIKFTDQGLIQVGVTSADGSVTFAVRDTGIGLRACDQERIFEPFVQVERAESRRQGGSGLGLAVSRDLARLLGGELSVTSELGEGSTFALHLPLAGASERGIRTTV